MSANTYEALNAKVGKTVVFKNGSSFYSIWSYHLCKITVATRAATEEIKILFLVQNCKNNLYSIFCWLWLLLQKFKMVWVRQEVAQDHQYHLEGIVVKVPI